MLEPGTRLGETFLTIWAIVRTNASMDANMTDQGELNSERFPTYMTLIGTNACVYAGVSLEVIGLCKGLVADFTFVWPVSRVDELVSHQSVSVSEGLLTNITFVGLDTVMSLHVRDKW